MSFALWEPNKTVYFHIRNAAALLPHSPLEAITPSCCAHKLNQAYSDPLRTMAHAQVSVVLHAHKLGAPLLITRCGSFESDFS